MIAADSRRGSTVSIRSPAAAALSATGARPHLSGAGALTGNR
ncbi:hypothetical protein [Streptosporangium sp. H16]